MLSVPEELRKYVYPYVMQLSILWTPTMSSWVIVLFQSSIASLIFIWLPLSTIFILTLKICCLWKMYSSSICFFCLLSHYFWIKYFLIFIFMVFNGSLAQSWPLYNTGFNCVGPPKCGLFSINIQFSLLIWGFWIHRFSQL